MSIIHQTVLKKISCQKSPLVFENIRSSTKLCKRLLRLLPDENLASNFLSGSHNLTRYIFWCY